MTRPTPRTGAPHRGFTLIELILVMAMLLSVLSLAAPSLSRFFRGRGLDVEAQRFLALTRHAQSRAVAEGVPMVLWLDREQRLYGVEAEFNYTDYDERAVEFTLHEDVALEVVPYLQTALTVRLPLALPPPSPTSRRPDGLRHLELFRFTPEGTLGDQNPLWVSFHSRHEPEAAPALWVAQSRNRLRYELRTDEPLLPR
ncbi:MAG: prepilin-type N-terminal cleavage/methylation domain-containing protein [Verrucomicrobiales bacterium]|nr:prepilin-type N-terminal cleavage/methylation domain-containing protein [Verrucomicrobiales bacterium]